MAQPATRFAWLDWFRFLAALTVVVYHAREGCFVAFGALPDGQRTLAVAAAYACTRVGHEAVVLFFVLSGFLVGGRALERMASGEFRPLDYAVDRFVRIGLPLVPALVLTAAVGALLGHEVNAWHFVGNLLSLQGVFVPSFCGNEPLWSLSYEVWFYVLVWAVGVALLKRHYNFLPAAVIVVIALIFTRLSPAYLFCWLIGSLAYLRRPASFSIGLLLAGLAVTLYAVTCFQIGKPTALVAVESFRGWTPSNDAINVLLAAGMALLIQQAILLKPQRPFWARFEAAGAAPAAFSYTLYLTHFVVLEALMHFGVPRSPRIGAASLAYFLFAIATCLATAWAIYWPFEKRTLEVRRWCKARLTGGARASATVMTESPSGADASGKNS